MCTSQQKTTLTGIVERSPCKYWTAHFWNCEENPLPELQSIIKSRFPSLVEVRITLEGGPNEDEVDIEEDIEGNHTYDCHVLLEFQEPLQVTYCDLAITRDGKHVAEPWNFEQAEEREVLQGKETGTWMEGSRIVILNNR